LWFYCQCLMCFHSPLDFKAYHFTVHLKEPYMHLHRMFCPEKWKIQHYVHKTEPDIFSKHRHQECIRNKDHLIPTQNVHYKWQGDCCSATQDRWCTSLTRFYIHIHIYIWFLPRPAQGLNTNNNVYIYICICMPISTSIITKQNMFAHKIFTIK